MDNAGIVLTSAAYLLRKMRGWSVFCKYWVGNPIKHQHTRNVRSRGSEVDEMKKASPTAVFFYKQCLLRNLLTSPPASRIPESSSALALCRLGHGRGQTQLLGCLSACACHFQCYAKFGLYTSNLHFLRNFFFCFHYFFTGFCFPFSAFYLV